MLQLYKVLVRLHRGLPPELEQLGNLYVRDEFKRHRLVTDRRIVDTFLAEWSRYAATLTRQLSTRAIRDRRPLGSTIEQVLGQDGLSAFSDHQILQLYQLKSAAEEATTPK